MPLDMGRPAAAVNFKRESVERFKRAVADDLFSSMPLNQTDIIRKAARNWLLHALLNSPFSGSHGDSIVANPPQHTGQHLVKIRRLLSR